MSNSEQQPTPDPESSSGELTPHVPPRHEQAEAGASGDGLRIPSKREVLAQLAALSTATIVGVVTPVKANATTRILTAMLSHLDPTATTGAVAVPDGDLITMLREHPAFLPFIKPLLTPEHFEIIVREAERD